MKLLSQKEQKKIFVRLKKAVKWVESVNGDIEKFAEKFKFERVDRMRTYSSSGQVFISKKRRLVVKAPYGRQGKIPEAAIPTIILRNANTSDMNRYCGYEDIYIQPLADVRPARQKTAFNLLIDNGFGVIDDHDGNVGWFKKCPVWIDW